MACVFMFIDHFSHIFMRKYGSFFTSLDYDTMMRFNSVYKAGRAIGRLAFPIYCFLLVEGFYHTKNLKKYMLRLLVMAVLSEHAFNLLASGKHIDPEYQNIFLTLLTALCTITIIHKIRLRTALKPPVITLLTIIVSAAGCFLAYLMKTDYSYYGVLAIIILYLLNGQRLLACIGGASAFIWEPFAMPAFIPIYFYNGKRGLNAKYFFYVFYPLHIYLIYFIIMYLLPDTF